MNLGVLFDINNFFAVGGSIGSNLLAGVAETNIENNEIKYSDGGWKIFKDDAFPQILNLQACVRAGSSIGLFYLYGLAGAGAYLCMSPRLLPGFIAEIGIGANCRFFNRHFVLGLEERVKFYSSLGFNITTGLVLGWHF